MFIIVKTILSQPNNNLIHSDDVLFKTVVIVSKLLLNGLDPFLIDDLLPFLYLISRQIDLWKLTSF